MSTTQTTALGGRFNARSIAPQAALDPLPAGDYKVSLTGGNVESKAPGHRRVTFEWTVLDGIHQGRKIIDGLNIENPSAENQRISLAQFSGICHAVGVYDFEDISALFNIPHVIKVDVEAEKYVNSENQAVASDYPGAKKYDARNRFKGAKFGNGNTAPAPSGQAPSAPASVAASNAAPTPPWGAAPQTPATPPATAGKPGKPGKPSPAAAPAPAPRMFYVGLDGPDYEKPISETSIADWLAKGMPANTPLALDDGKGLWKAASEFAIAAPVATPPAPQPPPPPAPVAAPAAAGPVPPWGRA